MLLVQVTLSRGDKDIPGGSDVASVCDIYPAAISVAAEHSRPHIAAISASCNEVNTVDTQGRDYEINEIQLRK